MRAYRLKRLIDVAVSVIALVTLWPVLVLVAIAIRVDSSGPALFRQCRVGTNQVPFSILKFRTMEHRDREREQPSEAVLTSGRDPGITRVGRILRASSVDELPQLINVLRGDMSLIGPRPVIAAQLEAIPPHRFDRFLVRPGLTGLAQVRGRRGLDWLDQLAADSEYVRRCSLLLDFKIALLTVKVVLTGAGVYGSGGSNWRAYRKPNVPAADEQRGRCPVTSQLEWMLITADPGIAAYAEDSGVHRIFVDMEVLGKAERQGHLDTHKAAHSLEDVAILRQVLTSSELMVRVNPLHEGSLDEVRGAVERGADRLMLPMFSTRDDVQMFREMVPMETPVTLLVETPGALARVWEWAALLGPRDEVHFGLNDLSLSMGLDFTFEPLAGDLLRGATEYLGNLDVAYGIGGVARPGYGDLPAEVVIGEHVRLGSCRAILSRAFHGSAKSVEEMRARLDLVSELAELSRVESWWRSGTRAALDENHKFLAQRAYGIAERRRRRA